MMLSETLAPRRVWFRNWVGHHQAGTIVAIRVEPVTEYLVRCDCGHEAWYDPRDLQAVMPKESKP